jgi:hypothetical protein
VVVVVIVVHFGFVVECALRDAFLYLLHSFDVLLHLHL